MEAVYSGSSGLPTAQSPGRGPGKNGHDLGTSDTVASSQGEPAAQSAQEAGGGSRGRVPEGRDA